MENNTPDHSNKNNDKLKKGESIKNNESEGGSNNEVCKRCLQDSIATKERGVEGGVGEELSTVLTTVVEDLEEEKKGKKRNRCFSCNKKVGLTGWWWGVVVVVVAGVLVGRKNGEKIG